LGPAIETIPKLKKRWDLVFIDADKANYINYWEMVVPDLATNALVVVDNVLWSGRVLNPQEKSDIAIRDFNRHALSDERMEVLMLPIRDGILLGRKK
jgi:caffeoyl-CoA O-methyltransferase